MTTKFELIKALNAFAGELRSPLSVDELRNGWTTGAQRALLELIQDIKGKLENEQALPDLSISRGLDSWGVTGGAMAEAAAVLSNLIREFGVGL